MKVSIHYLLLYIGTSIKTAMAFLPFRGVRRSPYSVHEFSRAKQADWYVERIKRCSASFQSDLGPTRTWNFSNDPLWGQLPILPHDGRSVSCKFVSFQGSTEGLYKELWDGIKYDKKGHLFSRTKYGITRVLDGGFAFIHPRMSLMYNIKAYGYKNFHMASDQFYFQGSGIAMRKGSPYRDKINEL